MHSKTIKTHLLLMLFVIAGGYKDVWEDIECDEKFFPDDCDFDSKPLLTIEDFERCATASLPVYVRNYILGAAGRGKTYRENREAFERIKIKPKMLQDTRKSSLEISALGQNVAFPIGISPTGLQVLADPEGENATAAAAVEMKTIMILSSYSSLRLEEVAATVENSSTHLWMQTYLFVNRSYTTEIVRRAEKNGFKALVLTIDSNVQPPIRCDAKNFPKILDAKLGNFPVKFSGLIPAVTTFNDIRWFKSITKLPLVIKGIMSGDDAQKAILAGGSAILVSNHGGRQLDGVSATIDALPEVVQAVNKMYPRREVYMDGGVRNGYDVYKAIARGAKMVFLGRAVLYGLALEGKEGVKKVLNIIVKEFNDTMLLSGAVNPSKIYSDSVIPEFPIG